MSMQHPLRWGVETEIAEYVSLVMRDIMACLGVDLEIRSEMQFSDRRPDRLFVYVNNYVIGAMEIKIPTLHWKDDIPMKDGRVQGQTFNYLNMWNSYYGVCQPLNQYG